MIKKIAFLCIFTICSQLIAQDIGGFWKSINKKTKMPQCVIAVYEYQDKYYGRIIGTFDEQGKMVETIDNPKGRAPGVEGNPYYCGLDLIWNLHKSDSRYKGRIIDPEKGRVYRAELWVENGNLIVRGELLIFGRNDVWPPAETSDFPPNFKKPDVSKFIPVIPEPK